MYLLIFELDAKLELEVSYSENEFANIIYLDSKQNDLSCSKKNFLQILRIIILFLFEENGKKITSIE